MPSSFLTSFSSQTPRGYMQWQKYQESATRIIGWLQTFRKMIFSSLMTFFVFFKPKCKYYVCYFASICFPLFETGDLSLLVLIHISRGKNYSNFGAYGIWTRLSTFRFETLSHRYQWSVFYRCLLSELIPIRTCPLAICIFDKIHPFSSLWINLTRIINLA